MPAVGTPIELRYQLHNHAEKLYCRAVVRDPNGVELSGSPAEMIHVGNGLYINNSFNMPNVSHVVATYEAFVDENYTILDKYNGAAEDLFVKSETNDIVNLLEELKRLILASSNQAVNFKILDDKITAVVSDNDTMRIKIEDQVLSSGIVDDTINVNMEEQKIEVGHE